MKTSNHKIEKDKNIFNIQSYISKREDILVRWSLLLLETILLGLQMRSSLTRILLMRSALEDLDLGTRPFTRLLRTTRQCETLQKMAQEIATLLDFQEVLEMRSDIQKVYPQDSHALDEVFYHFAQFKNSISKEQVYFEFSPSEPEAAEVFSFGKENSEEGNKASQLP
jgi:hypothetical protein